MTRWKFARRAIVDQVIGRLKTDASDKPVPMDTALATVLMNWRGKYPYYQIDPTAR